MVEKDIAFVLKRTDFRETSIIVTMFSRNYGKMTGILKGFYTAKKEFTSSMDTYTLNQIVFYPKQTSIWLVSFSDLLKDCPYLRTDYARNRAAAKCSEALDTVLPFWEKNEAVFRLFYLTLAALKQVEVQKAVYIFFIKLLTLCGLKPQFKTCLHCGLSLERNLFFSYSAGGLVCGRCRSFYGDAYPLLPETASSIYYIQHNNFPHVLRINPTLRCTEQILSLLDRFLAYHLHFNLLAKAEM